MMPVARSPLRWTRILAVAAPLSLVVCVVLIFGQSLGHQLVWDDEDLIVKNPAVRASPATGGFFASPSAPTRVLTNLTFSLEYRLWGLSPAGYHATNLVLHAAAALLLYLLAMRLWDGTAPEGRRGASPPRTIITAWLVALLFAAHPVNVEAVNSVALGRGYLLATCFILVALWSALEAVRRPGRAGALWWLTASAASLVALASHEIGAAVLPLMAILIWGARGWLREPWVRIARRGALGALITAVFLVLLLVWLLSGAGEVGPFTAGLWLSGLLVKQLIFPGPLCLWYDAALLDTGEMSNTLGIGAGVAAALALAGLLATYARRSSLSLICFYLIGCAVLPVFARQLLPFPLPSLFGERWLYLPTVFLALWVGAVVLPHREHTHGARPKRRLFAAVMPGAALAVLACIAAVVTVSESRPWRDNVELFRHAAAQCPPSAYVHAALGKHYFDRGETAQAQVEFMRAARIDPLFHRARIGLGLVALDAGDLQLAWRELSRAVQQAPMDADTHNGLGEVFFRMERYEEAIGAFERAIALRPSLAAPAWNLAVTLMKVNRPEAALVQWERVAELSPDPRDRATALEEIRLLRRMLAEHTTPSSVP